MWRVQSLEERKVTLDFSSAGLGPCRTAALVSDDVTLVNATTLIELEEDGSVQVIVCEACGVVRCQAGGWVQPRRFGDAVVWLPYFSRLSDQQTEYSPPRFLLERGIPFFGAQQVQRLEEIVPALRSDVIPALAIRDVVLVAQWDAPNHVLGKPGEKPHIKRDMIFATSAGELTSVLDHIQALLDDAVSNASSLAVPLNGDPGPELYLDSVRNTLPWSPLVTDKAGTLRLAFGSVGTAVGAPD